MFKSLTIITALQVFSASCDSDVKVSRVSRPQASLSEEFCTNNPQVSDCSDFLDNLRKNQTLQLQSISTINSYPDHVVKLSGNAFDENLKIAIDGQDIAIFKTNDTEVSFITPKFDRPGTKTGVLKRLDTSIEFKLFILADKSINPDFLKEASDLCEGIEFMTADGSIALGTKPCANLSSGRNCSEDGEVGCMTTESFRATDVQNASNKILAGEVVGGVQGNVILPAASKVLSGEVFGAANQALSGTLVLPSPAFVRRTFGPYGIGGSGSHPALDDCSIDGATGCVTTSTYKAADLSNLTSSNVRNGITIAGVSGTYPSLVTPLAANTATADLTSFGSTTSAGSYEFFDSAGAKYLATVAAGGTVTPTISSQAFSAAGTMYNSFTVAGDANLASGNIKSGVSIFSVGGNMTPAPVTCSTNGSQSCVATGNFYAATACAANDSNCFVPNYVVSNQPLKAISYDAIDAGKASLRSSLTLAGIPGTLEDCSANEVAGCVTTSTYQSADLTNLSESNIKYGVAIAGKTGTYPSAASPLTGASVVADLDFPTFDAKIKSAASFEWFDSSGARHTNVGDPDITAANITNNVTIFGVTGNLLAASASCTGDGQTGCTTTSRYKSMDTDSSVISAWDIRKGKVAGGLAGEIVFYKNMASTTYIADRTTGPGALVGIDFYDTIDDYNRVGSPFPTQSPPGWYQASAANWLRDSGSDLGSGVGGIANDGICNGTEICIYHDRVTALFWLKDTSTTRTRNNAITYCEEEVSGGYSDWRLPTQKELMQAYTNGIWGHKVAAKMNLASLYYWSSSNVSWDTFTGDYNWVVDLATGRVSHEFSSNLNRVLCVR